MPLPLTGAVAVTNGQDEFTWTGTPLTPLNCVAGAAIVVNGLGYFVAERIDTTHGRFTRNYAEETNASRPAEIEQISPDQVATATLNKRAADLFADLSVVEANGRGLFYRFSDSVADADPGPGRLRLNHATISSVTATFVDNVDASGATVAAEIDSWDDSTSVIKGKLWVRSIVDPSSFHAFAVTGAVIDRTGYRKLTLDYVGGSGGFAAEEELMVFFTPKGDQGEGLATNTTVASPSGLVPYEDEDVGFRVFVTDMGGAYAGRSGIVELNGVGGWDLIAIYTGSKGDKGDKGWVPVFASLPDGARRVKRLVAYTSGEGAPPTFGIGFYLGIDGLVEDVADATDDRGGTGPAGTIEGLTSFWQTRVTEDEVGLADQPAAEAGLDDELLMTPLTTAQAIAALTTPFNPADLEMTVSILALQVADNSNVALFLGPTGNRVADSFDALTYVDVAGATNLDTALPGALRPTLLIGPDLTTTAFAIADSVAESVITNAFDNNTGTFWYTDRLSTVVAGLAWVGQDFGAGNAKAVARLTLQQRVGGTTQVPSVKVQYASVEGAWQDAQTFAVPADTSAQTLTLTNPPGAYRFWRILANANGTDTGGNWGVAEIQMFEASVVNPLAVRSASFTAAAMPTKMKALLLVKEVDAAIAGTDYTLECSRDAGSTWAAMALAELYTMPSGLRVVGTSETSVSGQPSGTSPRWRFKTLNNKNVELHDAYLYWS